MFRSLNAVTEQFVSLPT